MNSESILLFSSVKRQADLACPSRSRQIKPPIAHVPCSAVLFSRELMHENALLSIFPDDFWLLYRIAMIFKGKKLEEMTAVGIMSATSNLSYAFIT